MPGTWEDATDAELLAACHAQEEPFAVFYRRHERLVASWLMRRCGYPDSPRICSRRSLPRHMSPRPASVPDRSRHRPGCWGSHATSSCAACAAHASRRPRASGSRSMRSSFCAASVAALEELEAEDPMRLLDALPPDQREAVRARVLEDLDYRELGARLHVSPAVARKRVSRGLSTLRRRIQHEGVDR